MVTLLKLILNIKLLGLSLLNEKDSLIYVFQMPLNIIHIPTIKTITPTPTSIVKSILSSLITQTVTSYTVDRYS